MRAALVRKGGALALWRRAGQTPVSLLGPHQPGGWRPGSQASVHPFDPAGFLAVGCARL